MSAYDLDDMAKAILEAIYQHGGRADTSEIKQYTAFKDNSKLHYRRKEHLEPKGFVETETVDKGDTLTVTEWKLTEKGEKAVDREMTKQDTPPLTDRVEELREIVSDLTRDLSAFEGRVDHIEETNVDDSEIDATSEEIEGVEQRVEQRLNRIEAKQDALLGVLWLYDLVEAERILKLGEKYTDDYESCHDTPEGARSIPFRDGAVGSTAGPALKGFDALPDTFKLPMDKLEEKYADTDEDSQTP